MHQEKRLDQKTESLKVGLKAVGIALGGDVSRLEVSGGGGRCL